MKYTLNRNGNFYKGNLHTHSTVSDGDLSPLALKNLYQAGGYQFLAITDHRKYGDYSQMNEPGFLMIPGVELDSSPNGQCHHVVGVGHPERNQIPHSLLLTNEEFGLKEMQAQELVDFLVSRGNEAIYAHPFWSYAAVDEIANLENILGLEIINYSCEQEWKSGIAEVYYEHLWNKSHRVWCFGSDDAHGHVDDFFGGYITVKCDALTYDAIFKALKSGSFYASYAGWGRSAPEIQDFYVEDNMAKIFCSPCRNIYLNVNRQRYFPVFGTAENPICQAACKIPEGAVSIKAICVDAYRNISWSQPILI